MEKVSSKRKRKLHSLDEEEMLHSVMKKVKRTNKDITNEFVKRKEQAHSLSSSESECSKKSPSKSISLKKSCKINNHTNKQNYHSISDESYCEDVSKSSKKQKSPKKSTNVGLTRDKNEFNHLLSSDEGCSNSINKSSLNGKVLQKFDKRFVKIIKTEFDGPSDVDSQIIETDQSNEGLKDEQRTQNHNISTPVKDKFRQKHAFSQDDEEEISKYSSLLDEELAEKNNIWILQCPNSLDCADLLGQSLDLSGNGSAHLNVGDTVFEAYSYRDHTSRSVTLAVPSSSNQLHICKIPVTGNIIIEECVNIVNRKSFSVLEPPPCVELPQNLRTRHPLLGLDYERKASVSSFPRHNKSSKKKKRSKSFNETSYSNGMQEVGLETSYEECEVKKKKHKKKKKSFNDD